MKLSTELLQDLTLATELAQLTNRPEGVRAAADWLRVISIKMLEELTAELAGANAELAEPPVITR